MRRSIANGLPNWVPQFGWSMHMKGYAMWTSRRPAHLRVGRRGHRLEGMRLPFRGERAHRYVVQHLVSQWCYEAPYPNNGVKISPEFVVHHMDFNKLNNRPENLILMPACFNPSHSVLCPYTHRYISRREAVLRGLIPRPEIRYSDSDSDLNCLDEVPF